MVKAKGKGKASASKSTPKRSNSSSNPLNASYLEPEHMSFEESIVNAEEEVQQNHEAKNDTGVEEEEEEIHEITDEELTGGVEDEENEPNAEELLKNDEKSSANGMNVDKPESVSVIEKLENNQELENGTDAANNADAEDSKAKEEVPSDEKQAVDSRCHEDAVKLGGDTKEGEIAGTRGNNVEEDLAAPEPQQQENSTKELTDEIKGAEESESAPGNEVEYSAKEDSVANEAKTAPLKVTGPKKKIVKKKVVKKKAVQGDAVAIQGESKPQIEAKEEEAAAATEENPEEGSTAPECEQQEEKMGEDLTDEIQEAANVTESKEDAGANEGKAAAEKVNKPRKILKKKVVRKKIVQGKTVAVQGEDKPQTDSIQPADKMKSVDTGEYVMNEENTEAKPQDKGNKKLIKRNKKRKVVQGHADTTDKDEFKLKSSNKNEPEDKGQKEAEIQVMKDKEEVKSGDGVQNSTKKGRAKALKGDADGVTAMDKNAAGPSSKSKSKKAESMGMIFMCSSQTKKDCYRFKILGLPAGKKEMVARIYKGMRLFLYDVDLKLLYGIYKAAGRGGYNIEPKAFKSKFPSQVRFTIMEDCLPLPEEKFKQAIKENYYTKNKFNCQLSHEQVRKLCKLFHVVSNEAKNRPMVGSSQRAGATPSSLKRKRDGESGKDFHSRGRSRSPVKRRRSRRETRERARPVVADDHYQPRAVAYEREPYLPPAAPPQVYRPGTSSYSYSRTAADDVDGRGVVLEYRDPGLSSVVVGHRSERELSDPYGSYREPIVYREPVHEAGARRDYYSSGATRVEYYPSAGSARAEYYPSAGSGRVEYYQPSEQPRSEYYPAAEYHLSRPSYRRY